MVLLFTFVEAICLVETEFVGKESGWKQSDLLQLKSYDSIQVESIKTCIDSAGLPASLSFTINSGIELAGIGSHLEHSCETV